MVSVFISRIIIVLFCQLYPAYASYKTVKTKNVKEYVKWMMYWIVFANFSAIETFADVFVSWLPFYYEVKILFLVWLLSPVTKGSTIIYRKLIHKQLSKHEKRIDSYIDQASQKGYKALLSIGSQGFNYASNVVIQTALRGQTSLVDQMKKSYSMNDLSKNSLKSAEEIQDETDNKILEETYREEISRSSLDISQISDGPITEMEPIIIEEPIPKMKQKRQIENHSQIDTWNSSDNDDVEEEEEEDDDGNMNYHDQDIDSDYQPDEDDRGDIEDEEMVTESIEIVHHRPEDLPIQPEVGQGDHVRSRKTKKSTAKSEISKSNTLPRTTRYRSKQAKCTF